MPTKIGRVVSRPYELDVHGDLDLLADENAADREPLDALSTTRVRKR